MKKQAVIKKINKLNGVKQKPKAGGVPFKPGNRVGVRFEDGNQWWLMRSKTGRKALFESPSLMWQAACEYFKWCIANPLYEIDYRGPLLEEVKIPKMRAFTIQGLCLYLDCNVAYFRQFKTHAACTDDFKEVISMIEDIIYRQKFEGATAGFLNANIIARDLGLVDKTESETKIKVEQITGMQFKSLKDGSAV